MNEAARNYVESSFLAPLIKQEGVTDLFYNGESFFYEENGTGRRRADISASASEVASFLRQIANLSERQFSFQSPILDVSFGRYRLNAVYASLARCRNEKSYSFSLRLASERSILAGNSAFFGGSEGILLEALRRNENIVIGGRTSSGKTELEKWCLLSLGGNRRVIVIDNVEELSMVSNPDIDLTTWLVNDSLPDASFPSLIKNALRSDPDYVIIAEARGAEMLEGILSALSGHGIITTIHAGSLEEMPERMVRLALLGEKRLPEAELYSDVATLFRLFVYLEKRQKGDGSIERRIASIGRYDTKKGKMEILFRRNEK